MKKQNTLIKIIALLFLVLSFFSAEVAYSRSQLHLSDQQALEIGQRIWRNECEGTVEGLTSWNIGEDFASLGIGHSIWYPVGQTGIFEESFPSLLVYLQIHGVKLPRWLSRSKGCPWPDRAAFMKDFASPQMTELRKILAKTVPLQARFAARRLERALPKILTATPYKDQKRVRTNFYRVATQHLGMYALMDYTNFKGEGISPKERYRDKGWGLLQVLQEMGEGQPMAEFSRAASSVLTVRVANSPPERNELRWLPGWKKRCNSYAR